MRIGILTGGGDSPGCNAAIRAVVRRGIYGGHVTVGFEDGWLGVMEGRARELSHNDVSRILFIGGTMLGTSRTNPFKIDGGLDRCLTTLRDWRVDALITIGGDDTNGVSHRLAEHGIKAVGIPQTIDNDIPGTDYCLGFDSAVNIVMNAVDRLHTTAESHHRVLVVEIMGRDAGWLALCGGISGGADAILLPEMKFDIDHTVALIRQRHAVGKRSSIIAVAEGAMPIEGMQVTQTAEIDAFGHKRLGGVGEWVAGEIQKRSGFETRTVILGHLQRGGSASAFDRILASRFGVQAVGMCEAGEFDRMVAIHGMEITSVPLADAIGGTRLVPDDLVRAADFLK
jgi:phosphofructokinase-like protein